MRQQSNSRDVLLILAASFFFLSSPMLVTPLITGFSGSIGAPAELMGIVGGLMNLSALPCRPFVGNLADRISKYRLSMAGAVLMILACFGYVFATNSIMIVLSRLINGVGYAGCSVGMSTWITNMLPKEKVSSGVGLYGMMNALGMAVAPAFGVVAYQAWGYRVSFVLALLFLLVTIVIIQFVSDKGEPSAERVEGVAGKEHKDVQAVAVEVVPVAIIIMLFAIPYCATQSFLVSYVETGKFPVSVSLFFAVYAVALLILRFTMKGLLNRIPFLAFLAGACVSELLSILLLTWMKNNFVLAFAAIFMAGGYGIMCSVCQATAILLAGAKKRGLANSTYYIGLDLGMILGPVIGGYLYGNMDLHLFYPILLATVPLEFLVCLCWKRTA